jgi:ribosomal protein S18 acetylase RimI-like enzyme
VRALDNAVWYAALGPRRPLAEVRPGAARFAPDVSPFAAVPDDPDPSAWADLGELVGRGGTAVLFRPTVDLPAAWTVVDSLAGVQMVAGTVPAPPPDDTVIGLTLADVPDMLELVAAAKPGPFGPRTVEFGGYIGLRVHGRLVAMAGERLSCGGFTEISAVCTAPDHRGKGLATRLVLELVRNIRARGEEAFLHASAANTTAIRLYETLGFAVRTGSDATVVRAPS